MTRRCVPWDVTMGYKSLWRSHLAPPWTSTMVPSYSSIELVLRDSLRDAGFALICCRHVIGPWALLSANAAASLSAGWQ
ncbi:unnamed protein product [Ixodes pacificus]